MRRTASFMNFVGGESRHVSRSRKNRCKQCRAGSCAITGIGSRSTVAVSVVVLDDQHQHHHHHGNYYMPFIYRSFAP